MFEHKFVVAAALGVMLAGCNGANNMYQPAPGWPPKTQTAATDYWDCTGQAWQQPSIGWLPLPSTQGMAAHDTMAFINACMAQRGWAQKW